MKTIEINRSLGIFLGIQVIIFIILSILLNISMFYGILMGLIISIVILKKKGFSNYELGSAMRKAFVECHVIFIIIFLMGAMISVWLASGTIPYVIYLGLGVIKGRNIVLMAFVISGLVSLTMGTALGAFSTIGIALLAIGKAYAVPAPLMIGAILSGAFISDKMAPVGGLVNLTLNLCGIKYSEYSKKAIKTLLPVVALTVLVYYFWGNAYIFQDLTEGVLTIQLKLLDNFSFNPVLLGLPILIMILATIGLNTVKIMSISLGLGSVLGVWIQKINIIQLIKYIIFGYKPLNDVDLARVLSGGGILQMIEVILIIFTVLSISYIFEYTGVTRVLTEPLTKNLDSSKKLYLRTGFLSILMTSLTCDQSMGIIMPAKLFKEHFDRLGIKRARLAQIIADTGIIIAPLEFWNVNALIITALTGVHAFQYGPYVVLCYLTPLMWLIHTLLMRDTKIDIK